MMRSNSLECHDPLLELESCPFGVALVARGRLCFANAHFMKSVPCTAGAEGLRLVFDPAPPASEQAPEQATDGANAVLYRDAPNGEGLRLCARMAPNGGEDAFFLSLPPTECAMPSAPARPRILLAEDNEINQEIGKELLEQAGVEVVLAANGLEALEQFLREDVDCILMDIEMPVMDGMEATRAIRASGKEGADRVPILAMTAHAMNGDRDRSLHVGMNDHLTKPIDPQLLYAALDVWLPKKLPGQARAPACEATGADASFARAVPAAQAPEQDIPLDLPGFDVRAGLANVAGNRELYLHLLGSFAKHYRNSGLELRDALQRREGDASAHEEAARLAHTAKGVAANLGARTLAAVAGDLESAIQRKQVQEELLKRYELLLREVLDSIARLPERDTTHAGQQSVSAADKARITAVLDALPALMQVDWFGAQQRLQALVPVVDDTVMFTHFREVVMALEEFDSEGVAEKAGLLLAAMKE